MQGAHQVQAQPPEVAGVGGAVAVLGPRGRVRALDGLAGAGALHGVESTTSTSSVATGLSAARCSMTAIMTGARRRIRVM